MKNNWPNPMVTMHDSELLQPLIDDSSLLVIVVGGDDRIELFNGECQRITGFDATDIVGQPLETVLQDCEGAETVPHRMAESGIEERPALLLCRSGTRHRVCWRSTTLRAGSGRHPRTLLTGRPPAAAGQTATREWLFDDDQIARTTIENATSGILAINSSGTICSVNPAAEALFGYRAAQMRGRNISMLMPEPHRSQHPQHILRYLNTGEQHIIGMRREVQACHRDGTLLELQLSVAEGVANGQRYFIGFTHDISAHKQAERNERLHLSHLAHATRIHAMDEIASTLAHEIRQPLTAVHTTAQAALIRLENGRYGEAEAREHLQQIAQQARRAGHIIDQLHRFTRRGDPDDLSEHHPSTLVEGVLLLLSHRIQATGTEAQRDYNAAECWIRVNRTQIEQVVFNLIDNAIDAMETVSGPRVLTVSTSLSGCGGHCETAIRDTGPGIAEAHFDQLFTPYFTTKKRGMGQGLPLCRSIIENHGGRLTAENGPDGGAVFRFSLPVISREEADA